MILNHLTVEAEMASSRYGLLTDSWRILFTQALNQSDFGSTAQAARIVKEAYAIADVFLDEERKAATRIITEIALRAHQTTVSEIASNDADELTDAALEHLSVTQRYIIDELIAQIHRDIALVRQTLQRVALEVSLAARSRGINQRVALIEYRIGNQAELQFMFHDRVRRKWVSKKFVRAIWRHTLLSVYNESVLLTLADHGITRAQVKHQDAGAESHDMVISFGSNSELPTYSEIRETVFHPNANAHLAMEKRNVPA